MPLIANGNVTFTLQATVANAGNTLTTKQFKVRFFHGAPDAGGVQIGAEQNVALAGCGSTQVVQVQWPDVPPGEYDLYVQVLPADSEDNAQNNVIGQRVFFVTHQTMLPLVQK